MNRKYFSFETHFHFTGCGGAGMAPMLLLLHEKGLSVSGSDIQENYYTDEIKKKGIPFFKGHSGKNLPEKGKDVIVIFSSAVSHENPELVSALEKGFKTVRRGEMLSLLALEYKRTVSVSGSHGKTSVSAMLSHVLKENGLAPAFLIGGKPLGSLGPFSAGNGDIFVTEADESDGTHALMDSFLGIVTNVDDDHCWSVGGPEKLYRNFQNFAERSKKLLFVRDKISQEIFKNHPDKTILEPDGEHGIPFVKNELKWTGFQLINASVAVNASIILGVEKDAAEKSLGSFAGVARRMRIHLDTPGKVLVEDYAHHPTEVKSALEVIRTRFPDYKLTVVFQPHRYARLKKYFKDFAAELGKADKVVITPVFAAWTEKDCLDSSDLAREIGKKAVYSSEKWEELANKILSTITEKELLAVLGAGDIDEIIPFLRERLKNHERTQ